MKGRNNKTFNVLLILFIVTFIVVVAGTSFAFFTAGVTGKPSNIRIQSAELGSATAHGTTISMFVSEHDMNKHQGSNSYTAYKESTEYSTLRIVTNTGSNSSVECTYDLTYKPTSVYHKSSANTANYKEFTLLGHPVAINESTTTISGTMPEVDLTGVATEITIVNEAKLIVNGVGREGVVEWRFTPRYYNLAINQNDNADKLFGGTIQVGSIACITAK